MEALNRLIRTIPDHPKPGIMFRDITTLLLDPKGFRKTVDELVQPYAGQRIDLIAGIEARGFILGGALAHQLSSGPLPLRKKGKLPGKTIGQEYTLEYGVDVIEIHDDAIQRGQTVLIADDLIATGGTAIAACRLIERAGGKVAGLCFIVDLPDLGGRKKLETAGYKVQTLTAFSGH
ncbi:MAG: adenine phosphoribosyltransferase [Alphaproteobacteria bacterium]|nr:adenine phosphoribosyltransferase [Alphaproteobacteria bacterium]